MKNRIRNRSGWSPLRSTLCSTMRPMIGGFRGVLCIIAAAWLCAACSRGESSRPVSEDLYPLPADALLLPIEGRKGSRIVTALTSEPETFNPILVYDADGQAFNQVMGAGLTRLNLKTQEPEPALAKSWVTSSDRLTW